MNDLFQLLQFWKFLQVLPMHVWRMVAWTFVNCSTWIPSTFHDKTVAIQYGIVVFNDCSPREFIIEYLGPDSLTEIHSCPDLDLILRAFKASFCVARRNNNLNQESAFHVVEISFKLSNMYTVQSSTSFHDNHYSDYTIKIDFCYRTCFNQPPSLLHNLKISVLISMRFATEILERTKYRTVLQYM